MQSFGKILKIRFAFVPSYSHPMQDLKLRFCKLMIEYSLHEDDFLAIAKFYWQIYETPAVKEDVSQWKPVLENIVLFTTLAPFDNEQSDMINRLFVDTNLLQIPLYKYVGVYTCSHASL